MKAQGRPSARERRQQDAKTTRAPRWAWPATLAVLFALALGWRLAYLGRLASSPYAQSLTEDAQIFWEWSALLLRTGVAGSEPYFLGPLYPHVVAVLRLIGADSIPRVLVIQALWGSAAVVLLADAVRRMTSPAAAVVAGLLVCFYEMAVFFDGLLLMESLLFFLEAVLLWWVVRTERDDRSLRVVAVAGVLIGLLALGRPAHGLLMVPALALLVPWRRAPFPEALRLAGAMIAAAVIVVLPATVRNAWVSKEWIPITYSGGYNLYVGNNPQATGGWVSITGTSARHVKGGHEGGVVLDGREYLHATAGLSLRPAESSRYWADRALAFMRDQPARTLRLTARKLGMLWNRREYAQIENVEAYRRAAGPVGLPVLGQFAVLGMLALGGAWLAWRQGRSGRFALAYVVAITAGVVPFFVTDRYRLHLVPGAVLLAGLCVERLRLMLRAPAGAPVKWIAAVALGAVIVHLPAPQLSRERLEWGIAADIASRWLEKGRPDLALPILERAVATEAKEARPGSRTGPTRGERAQLHYDYGRALMLLNRAREAVPWFELAAREAPELVEVSRALAEAYREAGESGRSDSVHARIPTLVGGAGLQSLRSGMQAAQRGRLQDAAVLFRQATTEDPYLYEAWGALIRAYVQLGDLSAADQALEAAKQAGLPSASYWAHAALVAAVQGRRGIATDALSRVDPAAIESDRNIAQVVDVTRGLLAVEP